MSAPAQLDGAHIEFASQIRNPIGIKLGPTTSPEDALALIERLDPDREPGRLTFISRMGARRSATSCPSWSRRSPRAACAVAVGLRPDARQHLRGAERPQDPPLRRRAGRGQGLLRGPQGLWAPHPGGIHVELTGDDVTECVGGGDEISVGRPAQRYETACDPRLNRSQSLDLAFLVAELLEARSVMPT